MVVLKRAMNNGKEAALAAKHTLESNNPATQPLLDLLPDSEPLPTMQQVEQKASKQLLRSLTQLAEQCRAANFKPLEVFSRSVQCKRREAGTQGIRTNPRAKAKLDQLPLEAKWWEVAVRALQHLKVPQSVGDLIAAYLQILIWAQLNDMSVTMVELCLNHMLPGSPQRS